MAHFLGVVQGNHGEVSRGGSRRSGIRTIIRTAQGSLHVESFLDPDTSQTMVRVTLQPWEGAGCNHRMYEGPIGTFDRNWDLPKRGTVYAYRDAQQQGDVVICSDAPCTREIARYEFWSDDKPREEDDSIILRGIAYALKWKE